MVVLGGWGLGFRVYGAVGEAGEGYQDLLLHGTSTGYPPRHALLPRSCLARARERGGGRQAGRWRQAGRGRGVVSFWFPVLNIVSRFLKSAFERLAL